MCISPYTEEEAAWLSLPPLLFKAWWYRDQERKWRRGATAPGFRFMNRLAGLPQDEHEQTWSGIANHYASAAADLEQLAAFLGHTGQYPS